MLFKETIPVCSENYMKHNCTMCPECGVFHVAVFGANGINSCASNG